MLIIAKCKTLESLTLDANGFSQKATPLLEKLPKLGELHVCDTGISIESMRVFSERHPLCIVHCGDRKTPKTFASPGARVAERIRNEHPDTIDLSKDELFRISDVGMAAFDNASCIHNLNLRNC